MKQKLFFSLVLASFFIGACKNPSVKKDDMKSNQTVQTFSLDTAVLKSGEVFYQCEMHHEIISDKSGKCPKCEMNLSKIIKN